MQSRKPELEFRPTNLDVFLPRRAGTVTFPGGGRWRLNTFPPDTHPDSLAVPVFPAPGTARRAEQTRKVRSTAQKGHPQAPDTKSRLRMDHGPLVPHPGQVSINDLSPLSARRRARSVILCDRTSGEVLSCDSIFSEGKVSCKRPS
jgi:hypothetical protein